MVSQRGEYLSIPAGDIELNRIEKAHRGIIDRGNIKVENGLVDESNDIEEQSSSSSFRSVKSSLGFVPALEGIRGIAILLVVYCHTSNVQLYPFDDFVGACGVSIFFVLSGFLITGILIKSQRGNSRHGHLSRFYMDRAVRLLPPMLPLFIYVWYRSKARQDEPSLVLRWIARSLFYLENQNTILFIDDFDRTPIKHLWSLSCEEQYYILWAFTLPFIVNVKDVRRRAIIMLCLVSIFTWTAWYAATVPKAFWNMHKYEGILANLYKMLIGSTLRLVPLPNFFFGKVCKCLAYIGIICTSLAAFIISDTGVRMWGAGFVGFFSAFLITSSLGKKGDAFLQHSFFRFFGRVSYSLYIWHYCVMRYDGVAFTKRKEGLYSCAVALCFSMVSTFYYEEPLRLKYATWKKGKQGDSHSQGSAP